MVSDGRYINIEQNRSSKLDTETTSRGQIFKNTGHESRVYIEFGSRISEFAVQNIHRQNGETLVEEAFSQADSLLDSHSKMIATCGAFCSTKRSVQGNNKIVYSF